MTNEELVAEIQAGDQNRMGELWEKTERFIAWKAHRTMTILKDGSTIEIDDLIQSGYFALVAAVKTYKPGDMVFVKWLSYYLQTEFAIVTGYRTERMRNDPCRWAASLDMPIGEDGDTSLAEIIPDSKATATIESIEDHLWREQLRAVEDELISGLQAEQREALTRHFLQGQTYEECAAVMGISADKVRHLISKGFWELRMPQNIKRLLPFFEFDFYMGTGLQSFHHSGESIQERYLIKKEKHEERISQTGKTVDDLRLRVAGLW